MKDIVERLRVAPTIVLDHHQVEAGAAVRRLMIERAESADEIERLRDELKTANLAIEAYKACLKELGCETEMAD